MTVKDSENKTATGECTVAVKTTLGIDQRIAGALRQGTKPTAPFCAWNDFVNFTTVFNAMGRAPPFCEFFLQVRV